MTTPPPGWYQDPTGETGPRYWDGSAWFERSPGFETPGGQPVERISQTNPTAEPVTTVVTGPNHVLHAVLTLLTCGLWLPIWLIIAFDNRQRITRIDAQGRPIIEPVSWSAVLLRIVLFIVVVSIFIAIMVNAGGK